MDKIKVSIVFRALNEEKWFADALKACHKQKLDNLEMELILVDSGSTDRTIEIAEKLGCRVVHIKKADFTFGRSLNYGCDAASGDYLVFISAHCIPGSENWLANLVRPLCEGEAQYSYGRQLGHEVSRFSEHSIFAQYFPEVDRIQDDDFFVNNANAAISKKVWEKYRFDEEVTGLEDMFLGKLLVGDRGRISYVADAPVWHIHEETFAQTQRRYFREALTLRQIMPEMHFSFGDFVRYYFVAILHDYSKALETGGFLKYFSEITIFRFMQYWGTYKGHNQKQQLSREIKEKYYYPRAHKQVRKNNNLKNTKEKADTIYASSNEK